MDEQKTTSLNDFEKQLKLNEVKKESSLEDFEAQLKKNIKSSPSETQGINPMINPMGQPSGQQNKQQVKVRKNIVLAFPLKYKLVA